MVSSRTNDCTIFFTIMTGEFCRYRYKQKIVEIKETKEVEKMTDGIKPFIFIDTNSLNETTKNVNPLQIALAAPLLPLYAVSSLQARPSEEKDPEVKVPPFVPAPIHPKYTYAKGGSSFGSCAIKPTGYFDL